MFQLTVVKVLVCPIWPGLLINVFAKLHTDVPSASGEAGRAEVLTVRAKSPQREEGFSSNPGHGSNSLRQVREFRCPGHADVVARYGHLSHRGNTDGNSRT